MTPPTASDFTRDDLCELTLDYMAACDLFTSEGWALAVDLENLVFLVNDFGDLNSVRRVLRVTQEIVTRRPELLSDDVDASWRADMADRVLFLC